MEFNCSGHSDYYIDLNSVRLLLRVKLVKTDGSDIESAEPNTVGCVNNLLHSMFSSLSISINGKPITLHETSYHYKAYLEKLLNYGSDASSTHLVSSFWYLDSSGELKDNSGFVKRLHYLSSDNTIELYGRLHADLFNSDKIAACTHSIEPEDYPLRHSSTCSFLFATPATIKRQCAYSVLSLDCVLIAAGWRSSSRTNHIYKYCTYTHILSVDSVSLSD